MRGLDPTRAYTAEVKAIWYDGTVGPRHQKSELKFTLQSLLPNEVLLTSLEPVRTGTGGGRGGGRGGPAGGLTVGGKRYEGGISARAGAEVEYDIAGIFTNFTAALGMDDSYEGALLFSVAGDGKELWSSGPTKKIRRAPSNQREYYRRQASGIARHTVGRSARGTTAGCRPRARRRRCSGCLAGSESCRSRRRQVSLSSHGCVADRG